MKKLPKELKILSTTKILVALLIVASFLLGSLFTKVQYLEKGSFTSTQTESAAQAPAIPAQTGPVDVSVDDDPFLGDKNAKVTMIEFIDFECPFCKRYWQETHPKIVEEYVKKGLVKFVARDFPLDFHRPAAVKEAIAAECAREQKGDEVYFKYHDEIFTRTPSNGPGMPEGDYATAAQKLGLDVSKFNSCLTSEKYKDEVLKDFDDGTKAGVSGTPTIFINGTPIVGAQPFESFKAAIDAELNKN